MIEILRDFISVGGVGNVGYVLAPVPVGLYLDELKFAVVIRDCVSSEYDNLSTMLLLLGEPPQKYPDEDCLLMPLDMQALAQ